MEIIRKYGANTTSELYELMGGAATRRLSDVTGQELELQAYVQYYDTDRDTGVVRMVTVFKTADGDVFGSASPTFNRDFDRMCSVAEAFHEVPHVIMIECGTSKAGRKFNTCKMVC